MKRELFGKFFETRRAVWMACLLLVAAAACNTAVTPPKESGAHGEGAQRQQRPARIISLTPSTTEILHGVGAFDRVVAV